MKSIERTWDWFRDKHRAYQFFRSPHGAEILRDLAQFCRAYTTVSAPTPTGMAILEGRRQVWLRIMEHLHMTPEELFQAHGGVFPITLDTEE